MKRKNRPECASCMLLREEKACVVPGGAGAKGCPTLGRKAERQEAQEEYRKKEVAEFALQATIQEGECYADRDKRPYVMHAVKPRMLGDLRICPQDGLCQARTGLLRRFDKGSGRG